MKRLRDSRGGRNPPPHRVSSMWRFGVQLDFPELHAQYLASELAAEQYTNEEVDGSGRLQYIDTSVSVSALLDRPSPIWCPVIISQQERSFLHGS